MPYQVEFERFASVLRVCLHGGSRDLESTLAAWGQIAAEIRRDPPAAVLVVSNVQGEPFDLDKVRAFVAGVRGLGLEALRIAYVYPHFEGWSEVEAGGIFALEYGFEARAFTNEDEARVWLRHGER